MWEKVLFVQEVLVVVVVAQNQKSKTKNIHLIKSHSICDNYNACIQLTGNGSPCVTWNESKSVILVWNWNGNVNRVSASENGNGSENEI